jgi:antitoxin MazE
MKTQIGKWGNSLAVRIPKYIIEQLQLETADEIDCRVEDGKIVMELLNHDSDYTLEELLAMPLEKEGEVDWGEAQGEEVW